MESNPLNIRLGTDIVYIPRIQTALERFGERFLQRVYTFTEQRDCWSSDTHLVNAQGRINRVSVSRLAGRWAAKEAVAKALGTGWRGLRYTDIEIQRHSSGAPQVYLYPAAVALVADWGPCDWQLSLSHDGDYAIATAIAYCSAPKTSQHWT